jgi:hypothetical protein
MSVLTIPNFNVGAMVVFGSVRFGKFDFQLVIDFHRNDQGSISNVIPTRNEWKNEECINFTYTSRYYF